LVEVEVVLGIVGALIGLWLVSVGSHGGLEVSVVGFGVALRECRWLRGDTWSCGGGKATNERNRGESWSC